MQSVIYLKINKLEKELGLKQQHSLPLESSDDLQEAYQDCDNDAVLFIGDNLHYLEYFAIHAPGSIDACYIDPPYNTGSKFLYPDKRTSGSVGTYGSHSTWMSFMLPRLVLAHEMLKASGVMAISIDDYEHAYLKILMDRIFGEENFIGNIVVCRSKNGKGSRKNIAPNHEYLLVYGKSEQSILRGQKDDDAAYNKCDQFGRYRIDGLFRKKGAESLRADRPNMFYPLYFEPETGKVSVNPAPGWKEVFPVDSKGIERRWLWGSNTTKEREWQLYASQRGVVYVKNYAGNETSEKRTKTRTLWSETSFYTERATNEITKLFGSKIFDTPKPLEYIKKVIDTTAAPDAVIMDFFAGSGTTAHAIAELNQSDSGTRKCILMEADSEIPSSHTAYKAGFKHISEITEARLKLIKKAIPSFTFNTITPRPHEITTSQPSSNTHLRNDHINLFGTSPD